MNEKITNENTSQAAGSSTTIVNEFEMKNFQNSRKYEKTINTGKLRVYIGFPLVYYLLSSGECSGEWMESYGQKKHVKNRVKFKQTCREVQILHAVHFRRICFAIKAERMISPFSKLLENGQDSQKTINMKKFRIFRSFSAVYYLPHSDKVCRNYAKIRFQPFSNLT